MFCYELKTEEAFMQLAIQYDKIIIEGDKKYLDPIKSYQRKNAALMNENFQTIGL